MAPDKINTPDRDLNGEKEDNASSALSQALREISQQDSPRKKNNPVQVYAIVSQVAFMVITPLLLFIWGGSWLIGRFSLPQWLMPIFILLGIGTMISSVGTYLMKISRMFDDGEKPNERTKLKHDPKDHDY